MTKEKSIPAPFVAVKSNATKQIGIMVTPEKHAIILEAAQNDGISVSEYVRQLIENDLAA